MNWLEVGCPHCPNVVTFPLAAAGRVVRCPECEKTYLVPSPGANGAWATAAAPREPPSDYDVESSSDAPPSKSMPEADRPTVDYAPEISASANEPTSVAATPPAQSTSVPTTSAAPRRSPVESTEPQLAVDSPLPELPILNPPREAIGAVPTSSTAAPARETRPSIGAPPPPSEGPSRESQESGEEAQTRMRRAEMRAKVNLAIFVVGTMIMIAFSYLVIYFGRRR